MIFRAASEAQKAVDLIHERCGDAAEAGGERAGRLPEAERVEEVAA